MANVDIGIVGAGVMGSNLALNICDKGFRVALYDTNPAQIATVLEGNAAYSSKLSGFAEKENLSQFIQALQKPRKVIILVPAGKITDAVIHDLASLMDSNDVIIDVGNAHFRDQDRRAEELEARGLRFLGMGVSGGAEGARKGPAFFPGGTLSVWEDIKEIVEAAAAKAEDGRPCVTMNGKGGAGSCVKMFHNAGEYAVLQVWGEVHEIMKSYGISTVDQKRILSGWKTKKCGRFDGFLSSYMLDITVEVVGAEDSEVAGGQSDGSALLSKTMDKTDSKGTGLWSVVEAMQAAVPVPTLAAAVLARQMSMLREERHANANKVPFPSPPVEGAKWTDELESDLFYAAGMSILASYAQMFQSLRKLDQIFEFGVQLPATIATFRAGCILQGFMLSPMTKAFEEDPNLSNLIAAFEPEIREGLPSFKRLISHSIGETSSTIPCMYASLDYVQTMLTKEIPSAQCVSLQRDVFGRHGFERLDKEGRFNASWQQLQAGDAATTEAKSAVVKDVSVL